MWCFVFGKVYVKTCKVMPALRHPEFTGKDQTDTTKLKNMEGEGKQTTIYPYIYIITYIHMRDIYIYI